MLPALVAIAGGQQSAASGRVVMQCFMHDDVVVRFFFFTFQGLVDSWYYMYIRASFYSPLPFYAMLCISSCLLLTNAG